VAAVLSAALGKLPAKAALTAATAEAAASGRSLGAVLAGMPDVTAHLPADRIEALLDPLDYLGVAGHLVDRALSR
jgi:3-carboxy-cis,cis-muconate cycloisomerase